MASNSCLRREVLYLYKNLLYYGKEYPLGYTYFRDRLKRSFLKNHLVEDKQEIERLIKRGEYVIKEIEALYMLKKYRTLKRNYYDLEQQEDKDRLSDIIKNLTESSTTKTI